MPDTPTDDIDERLDPRGAAPGDQDPEPRAGDGDAAPREDDGPVEPPVIGCPRCEALVVLGSRYCPSCGVPLVRSGEQAATALSRTRRRAPIVVRLAVPVLLLGVLAAIWFVAHTDPLEAEKDTLRDQLSRVVDDHRALSDRLVELGPGDDPAAALRAARATSATLQDVQDETDDVESGTTGRTTRVRTALATDRVYLGAVVAVLGNPRSPLLDALGRRSARAVAALRSVEDISPTAGAIRGTKALGAYARGRAGGSSAKPSSAAAKPAKRLPPFVGSVERVIRSGAKARPDVSRGFALLRAARDGVSSWSGSGKRPASAAAAVAEARRRFADAGDARTASATAARGISAAKANQRALTEKLAAAYTAGAATSRKLTGCIASFQNSGPESIARQCLQGVRPQSAAEATAVDAFTSAYRPARTAAGLPRSGPSL
jgi:hypothetical protein